MKKETTKPKKTTRKITKATSSMQPVFFQRIIVVTTCLVLVVAASAFVNRQSVGQAVAGTSIARGLFMQAQVGLPGLSDAVSYNIYYKQSGHVDFTNAVRNIPANVHTYTISYLKKDTSYDYRVAAVDKYGKEFFFSDTRSLQGLEDM